MLLNRSRHYRPVLLTFHEYRQAMQESYLFSPATIHWDYMAHCEFVRQFEV